MVRSFVVAVVSRVARSAAARQASTAQEAINYGSVSGKVTDVSGGGHRRRPGDRPACADQRLDDGDDGSSGPLPVWRTFASARTSSSFARRVSRRPRGRSRSLPVRPSICPWRSTVGPVETSVTVTADATLLEAARSQITATVTEAEVRNLPLNGRNVLDLALLAPGVSPTNVGGGTQLFAETSAVPGVGISVGSQRNLSNNFIVDGLSANDDAAGLSGISYGADAVDQFQVVTSGGQAELGRALGGYISVVTRSGTNLLRGDVYGFFRDDRFNAPNPLLDPRLIQNRKLPMHQSQFGFSAGGPVAKDRTFFFSNVEARRLDQSGLVDDFRPGTSRRSTHALPRSATAGRRSQPASMRARSTPRTCSGKIDHQLSAQDHLTLRYSLYDVASAELARRGRDGRAIGVGGCRQSRPDDRRRERAGVVVAERARDAGAIRPQRSRRAACRSDRTIREHSGRRVVRDAVEQPDRPREHDVPGRRQPLAPGRRARAQGGRGHSLQRPHDYVSRERCAAPTPSRRSRISWPASTTTPDLPRPSATRSSAQTNPNVGIYVQDEWRVGSRVTLNAGLRYDLQYLETIATDTRQRLAARRRRLVAAGVAADAGPRAAPDGSTIACRCGRSPTRCSRRGTRPICRSSGRLPVSLSPAQAGAPVFPNILPAVVPTVTLVNLTTIDRRLQNAYSNQASVEVEQQLGPRQHDQRRLRTSARAPVDHADQPERADVRRVGHATTAAARTPTTRTTTNIRRPAARTTTRCTSRSCSALPAGAATASRTPTRSR